MTTSPNPTQTDNPDGPDSQGTWDRTSDILEVVDQVKSRVDELRVQLDLAKLELRDQAKRQIELAENANLAVASKLRDAYRDATATAEQLRDGVDELLHDVKEAFDAVQDVIARG